MRRRWISVFSLLVSGCFAQCRSANALTASLWDLHTSSSKTHTHLTLRLREYLFNIAASKTFCRFSRFGFNLWLCWQFKEICQELDKNNWLLCSSFLRHHVVYGVISIASNSSFNSVTIDLGKQTVKQSLGICVVFPRSCKNISVSCISGFLFYIAGVDECCGLQTKH